jgi:hypothetical protein
MGTNVPALIGLCVLCAVVAAYGILRALRTGDSGGWLMPANRKADPSSSWANMFGRSCMLAFWVALGCCIWIFAR